MHTIAFVVDWAEPPVPGAHSPIFSNFALQRGGSPARLRLARSLHLGVIVLGVIHPRRRRRAVAEPHDKKNITHLLVRQFSSVSARRVFGDDDDFAFVDVFVFTFTFASEPALRTTGLPLPLPLPGG